MQKRAKINIFCHFFDFGSLDLLDIAYDDGPKYFSTSSSGYRSCTIKWACIMCIDCASVKCAHMHIGLFLDFGGLDRLYIAYYGSPKCFSTCGAGYSSCINPVHAQCA